VRNSSLVERFCAENVTGLKHITEAAGASNGAVGERSQRCEGRAEARLERFEVSMPESVTKKRMKNPFAASPRFPGPW